MAERITPEKSLDLLTTRKPSDWSDCVLVNKVTGAQRVYLKGLHLYPCADDHLPMADLVKPTPDGGNVRMPQRFVLKHKGAYYYINTEGYSYCRYVLRIPAELFGAEEPVQEPKPEPIFEDKTEPDVTENEVFEALKQSTRISDKVRNLVLASKVLASWLELNGYPAKTKVLAKALEDAINDL